MSFHNPGLLWGLLGVLIPVIIHLFNFRRIRKVYFPTLAFLQEVIKKNQRRSELKHLLVLFTRILAIIALVFAFAGPYIPSQDQDFDLAGDRPVSVYLDNSFSMQSGNSFEANFLKAKEELRRLVEVLPQGTRYQFISNDQKPGSSLFLSRDDLLDELEELQIGPAHHDVAEMIAVQQHNMPAREREKAVYFVISDFQHPGSAETANLETDSVGQYFLLPVTTSASRANLSIDSAWFGSPIRQLGSTNDLMVKVSNFGDLDLEKISVRLFIDGTQHTAIAADLGAGSSKVLALPFMFKKEGFQRARIELSDYPVTFDDSYEMVWRTSRNINISHIYSDGSGQYIQKLFGQDSAFVLKSFRESQIDFSTLRKSRFIILENLKEISSGMRSELNEFLKQGGTVLLFPPHKGSMLTYNEWLAEFGARYLDADTTRSTVDRINPDHELFAGVFEATPQKMDMPAVFYSYPMLLNSGSAVRVLDYRIDRPFLAEINVAPGHIYLCASPLDEKAGFLPNHSLFVYLTLNMALRSGGQQAIAYSLQPGSSIPLGDIRLNADQVPRLKAVIGDVDFIPEITRNERSINLSFSKNPPAAGTYQLKIGEEILNEFAFNNGREESSLFIPGREELETWVKGQSVLRKVFVIGTENVPLNVKLSNAGEGRGLEIWLVIVALVFLLLEVIFLRWL